MLLILAGCLNALPNASEGSCDEAEVCNERDDDCDGSIDEGASDALWWGLDEDGDGFGSAASAVQVCSAPPTYVPSVSDCDDSDEDIHLGADEYCGGIDDDCDGQIDEGALDADIWYGDADGDAWGVPEETTYGCEEPDGYAARVGDCDDNNSSIHPEAAEVCNGLDDDCDGDSDGDAIDAETWWTDTDGDGFGDASTEVIACDRPGGTANNPDDCDDGDIEVNPNADEICNAVDDDCSDLIDDGDACPCDTHWDDDDDPYLFCIDLQWHWWDALSGCGSAGYHLTTVDDEDENTWIIGLLRTKGEEGWWTGYNDIDHEGDWVWEDGSTSTWTNWADDQPNNWDWGGQDCMELYAAGDETWNDADCDDERRFICELN